MRLQGATVEPRGSPYIDFETDNGLGVRRGFRAVAQPPLGLSLQRCDWFASGLPKKNKKETPTRKTHIQDTF